MSRNNQTLRAFRRSEMGKIVAEDQIVAVEIPETHCLVGS
jgi:hypothetical protein